MKKSNLISKRFFSIILTIAVALSMMLTIAWAVDGDGNDAPDGSNAIALEAAGEDEAGDVNAIATQQTASAALDDINAEDGSIKKGGGITRTGPALTADNTTLSGQYYIVKGNITIDGNLTVDGTKDGALVLSAGAKLTINGALIHEGGEKFYIYGGTSEGTETGQLVIKNLKDDGAAIRSASANSSAAKLRISSGEVTINGGNFNKLVDGVTLYSESKIHKGTLDGTEVLPAVWSSVSGIEGNTLVLEYCKHNQATYTSASAAQHIMHCEDCGFTGTAVDCTFNGNGGYDQGDANGHYNKCVCGNTDSKQTKHEIDTAPTEDGKKHTSMCLNCGYKENGADEAAHTYDPEYGSCNVCNFTPIMSDSNGNLYDNYEEAFAAVVEGNAEYVQLESEVTGGVVRTALEFDYPGKMVTLRMNNKTLSALRNATLEVSGGSLIIEGEANISVPGSTQMATAIKVTGGTLTFADNLTAKGGATDSNQSPAIEVTGGTVNFNGTVNATVGDADSAMSSSADANGLAPAIKVTGGKLTFVGKLTAVGGKHGTAGNVTTRAAAVHAEDGELDFQGDLDLNGGLTLINNAILTEKLTQGTFYNDCGTGTTLNVTNNATYNKNVMKLLKDNHTFVEKDNPEKYVYNTSWSIGFDVTIKYHEHKYEPKDNIHTCKCGASESHTYVDGKCEICQYVCPHTTVDTGNNSYVCMICNQHMLVQINKADGTTTYSTDFTAAMNEAENGTTIMLLENVSNDGKHACITGDDITVTLNLDGHTINGGWIKVGRDQNGDIKTSSTLKIIGSGSFISNGNLSVNEKATLDLSDWTGGEITGVDPSKSDDKESTLIVGENAGTIGTLQVLNWPTGKDDTNYVINTKLSGGSYGRIWITMISSGGNDKAIPYSSMLAKGYAFQYVESGKFVPYETKAEYANGGGSLYNVKVVKCQHPGLEPDETGMAKCTYCNAEGKFVASVDGNLYENMDDAITAWLKDDESDNSRVRVLKLYKDYEADATKNIWNIEYNVNKTLDLNGHTMSVDGNGAFKPGRVEGSGMALTIRDTSQGQNGSISHIVLSSENNYGSLTLESGHISTLEVADCKPGGVVLKGGSIGNLNMKIDEYVSYGFMLEGGSIGAYSLPKGMVLADLLECFGYYCTDSSVDLAANARTETSEITFTKVKDSVIISAQAKSGETSFGGNIPFTPIVEKGASTVTSYSMKWYRKTEQDAQLMETVQWDASGSPTKTLDSKAYDNVKAGNELEVFCVIQAEDSAGDWQTAITGYKLTVKAADLSNATVNVTEQLTYTGSEQSPTIEVKLGEKTLVENTDYTVSVTKQTNAGTDYTLTVTAVAGGNYTGSKEQTWTIKPATLTIDTATAEEKTYDGKNDATVNVNFKGLVNNEELTAKDYTITANYVDATASKWDEVNNTYVEKDITGTVTLNTTGTAKNYVLANDGSFKTKGIITKAAAPSGTLETTLDVVNNYEARYTVALPALPKLPDGYEYGDSSYHISKVALGDYCTYTSDGGAGFTSADTIFLDINKVDTKAEGSIGTVTVTVSTTNYQDITLTINVNAVNKKVPVLDGELTFSKEKLTYGESLDLIKISGTMKDDETEVEGTFAWETPDAVLNAGEHEVGWVFTPDNSGEYMEVTGKTTIMVEKATPTGEPNYEKITASGKTLADAKLAVKDADEQEKFSVPGEVKWIDADGNELEGRTEVKRGESYTWIFTPTDAANYETITGTIVLWAKSSGGGGGSVTIPSSEVKTDDKTSQTGEKEKVTTSPTEVKNETKTDESGNQVTTATVTVSEANKKEILKQAKENKSDEIIIKVSKDSVKDGAKLELNLEKSFIESILNDTDADLTIQTPDGEKTFTQEELKKLVESASGNTVTLDTTSAGTTDPADPTNPTSPSTDKNAKLIKGVQNTTIVLKSKLLKSGKIRLTWTKSKGYKVDRFEIYRSVKKNSGYGKKAFFTTKSGSAAKYLNTKSLKKGKTYYYKLRGIRIIDGKKYCTQWSNKTWKTVK